MSLLIDMGGLSYAVISIAAIMVSLQLHSLDTYMIMQLYKKPSKYSGKLMISSNKSIDMCKVWNGGDSCVESLDRSKIWHLKFLLRRLPFMRYCLKLNDEEQLFEEGKS